MLLGRNKRHEEAFTSDLYIVTECLWNKHYSSCNHCTLFIDWNTQLKSPKVPAWLCTQHGSFYFSKFEKCMCIILIYLGDDTIQDAPLTLTLPKLRKRPGMNDNKPCIDMDGYEHLVSQPWHLGSWHPWLLVFIERKWQISGIWPLLIKRQKTPSLCCCLRKWQRHLKPHQNIMDIFTNDLAAALLISLGHLRLTD